MLEASREGDEAVGKDDGLDAAAGSGAAGAGQGAREHRPALPRLLVLALLLAAMGDGRNEPLL